MKKAVVYARHITYRKYEKNIQEQFNMANEFAKENNLKIVDRYFDLCNNKQKKHTLPMRN